MRQSMKCALSGSGWSAWVEGGAPPSEVSADLITLLRLFPILTFTSENKKV